jgi:hypothetical protein
MSRLLHLHYPLYTRLGQPQSSSGCHEKKNKFLALPGIEPRFLGLRTRSLVTTLTEVILTNNNNNSSNDDKGLLYYSLLLVMNKGLLYLFIVTTQQDAFTHNKKVYKDCCTYSLLHAQQDALTHNKDKPCCLNLETKLTESFKYGVKYGTKSAQDIWKLILVGQSGLPIHLLVYCAYPNLLIT